jgi:hypothetical protein
MTTVQAKAVGECKLADFDDSNANSTATTLRAVHSPGGSFSWSGLLQRGITHSTARASSGNVTSNQSNQGGSFRQSHQGFFSPRVDSECSLSQSHDTHNRSFRRLSVMEVECQKETERVVRLNRFVAAWDKEVASSTSTFKPETPATSRKSKSPGRSRDSRSKSTSHYGRTNSIHATSRSQSVHGQGVHGQGVHGQGHATSGSQSVHGQGVHGQGVHGQGVSQSAKKRPASRRRRMSENLGMHDDGAEAGRYDVVKSAEYSRRRYSCSDQGKPVVTQKLAEFDHRVAKPTEDVATQKQTELDHNGVKSAEDCENNRETQTQKVTVGEDKHDMVKSCDLSRRKKARDDDHDKTVTHTQAGHNHEVVISDGDRDVDDHQRTLHAITSAENEVEQTQKQTEHTHDVDKSEAEGSVRCTLRSGRAEHETQKTQKQIEHNSD